MLEQALHDLKNDNVAEPEIEREDVECIIEDRCSMCGSTEILVDIKELRTELRDKILSVYPDCEDGWACLRCLGDDYNDDVPE
jgi:hypothetical protein